MEGTLKLLGLDVGTRTVGVAGTDALGLAVHPVATLARKGLATDLPALAAIATKRGAEMIVVGLPYELDGSEGRSARLARQVGDGLAELGWSVVYQDERFTSVEAVAELVALDVSRARRREVVDQRAAVLIVERWLDARAGRFRPS